MSDLISRSALENSLTHCKELGRKTFEAVLNVIKEQPAIEAVPVVRGEWLNSGTIVPVYICSKCSYATILGKTRFCPGCGSPMDGKDV
jgi:rubrerythrin